ncbi:hypothetical protein ISF_02663 [Cordyceps fumosorosea ARSEF 2679]|uniref:Uncharacterized protein n=1 Tax=Cordyceps fumosorosea (strain ARSEF 2679) TaxID=1081104 RepID=A0A162MUI6_CORFA|nr:hypothetical protein ISF_02663 [Cordyceps fumosorosea ARSEF 2679]OAA70689.1 hypothetical protein ISF_02663 [Cordyceps fumosorosea ARSEF 2679]
MNRQHCASPALSDTTYYSFNDIELVEPPEPRTESDCYAQQRQQHKRDFDPFEASIMQRQDSGYESYEPPSPRTFTSNGCRPSGSVTRRNSSASNPPRLRSSRPSTRRSARSYNTYSSGNGNGIGIGIQQQQPPYKVRSYAQSQPVGYVQFPEPDLVELAEPEGAAAVAPSPPSPPPQTTHYWTSDSTRRLEYAAIDAAGRGVKGWVRKHLVPDCLVPDQKHLSFDDDTGSVRRYRLHLEDDLHGEKHRRGEDQATRRKSWRFWRE